MNQYQVTTVRGQGVEIDTAVNGSAVYWSIRGQSISDDAGTYVGTRDDVYSMLLSPLGLKEQNGRIVEQA